MAENKEQQKNKQLAYNDAVKGKTEDEIAAINYFFGASKNKGCIKKTRVPLVTDSQYDELVSKRAAEISNQSILAALGLTADTKWFIEPFKIYIPDFNGSEYVKIGGDDKARASRITITCLMYGEDTMHIYYRTISLTDRYSCEWAASLMYKDVTSVALNSTTTETLREPNAQNKAKQSPVWVPSVSNSVVFTVPGKTYEVNVGNSKSVQTVTIARLREKIAACKK